MLGEDAWWLRLSHCRDLKLAVAMATCWLSWRLVEVDKRLPAFRFRCLVNTRIASCEQSKVFTNQNNNENMCPDDHLREPSLLSEPSLVGEHPIVLRIR